MEGFPYQITALSSPWETIYNTHIAAAQSNVEYDFMLVKHGFYSLFVLVDWPQIHPRLLTCMVRVRVHTGLCLVLTLSSVVCACLVRYFKSSCSLLRPFDRGGVLRMYVKRSPVFKVQTAEEGRNQ